MPSRGPAPRGARPAVGQSRGHLKPHRSRTRPPGAAAEDDPEAPLLGGLHCLPQTCTVQAPERSEGGGVHLEDPALAKGAGAVQRRARRHRRQHGRPVEHEEVQAFLHFKARFKKAAAARQAIARL